MIKLLSKIAFLTFPLLVYSCAYSGNLLTNPGFESGSDKALEGWEPTTSNNDSQHFQFSLDNESHSGQHSLKIVHSQPNDSWFAQEVSVKEGCVYKLSGWVKTENVRPAEGKVGAYLGVSESYIRTASVKETQGWTHVQCIFKTSANRIRVNVVCRLASSSGIAWFDDIELKEEQLPANTDVPVL